MTTERPGCPPDNDAYRQFGASGGDQQPGSNAEALGALFPDHTATLKHVVDVLNGVAPGCALTEDTDSEAFAALPDCRHCEGTGKDLAGSPWETITEED